MKGGGVAIAVAGWALCAASLWSARASSTAVPLPRRWGLPALTMVSAESLGAAAELLERRDPFRRSRRPLPPAVIGANPAPSATATPLPHVIVRGIIGGPPWSAVLDGVPGKEGPSLLQPGDTSGGLQLVAIDRAHVVLRMRDSSWTVLWDGGGR